jgi:hypothetical protein
MIQDTTKALLLEVLDNQSFLSVGSLKETADKLLRTIMTQVGYFSLSFPDHLDSPQKLVGASVDVLIESDFCEFYVIGVADEESWQFFSYHKTSNQICSVILRESGFECSSSTDRMSHSGFDLLHFLTSSHVAIYARSRAGSILPVFISVSAVLGDRRDREVG